MPEKRALLVGINEYPHVPPLDGCVNDTQLMRSLLVERFGFPEQHITHLTNAQATRAGILAAFDALVAATGPDDIVVFHFAGHGSQMADREGDEPGGFDSTLVPFDGARPMGDTPDITDDEINLRIEALALETSYITLIVDACHSGTVTRDDFGERARSIDGDRRPAADLPPSPIPPARRGLARVSGPSGWMPLADKYVLIAGCRDDEQSYEYRPPEGRGKVVHGSLTYFLCQQLRTAPETASYRDVFERTAALVNAEHDLQHPQMEGRSDRIVFGVTDAAPSRFVGILEREDDAVLLAAGAAHGAAAGSTWRVCPHGARDPESSLVLGEVTILEVQAVTALGRIAREARPGAIAPGDRAFEHTHVFGDLRLPVVIDAAGDAASLSALRAGVERSRLVVIAAADVHPAVRIVQLAPRTEVTPSSPAPQVGALAEPRWAAVGASGDLVMPLQAIDQIDAVVENLERLARHRQVLAIENPSPGSRLRGRFALAIAVYDEQQRRWSEAGPGEGSGQIVLDEGAIVSVVVRSRHDAPAYISLHDLGLTGAISQIYPAAGAQEPLRPNGELATEPMRLQFPEQFPYVTPGGDPARTEGIETVKLFVTEQPADFSGFGQEGVRDDEGVSPLATLLSSAFNGRTTRDEPAALPLDDEDWTTVTLPIVLRRRSPS